MDERKREKNSRTDVRRDAGKDDLAFILRTHGSSKVGIVPCVYFAVSLDQRCVRIQGDDFFRQGAVGSRLRARSEDDGDVEDLGDGGVGDDVVSENCRIVIADLRAWRWLSGILRGC